MRVATPGSREPHSSARFSTTPLRAPQAFVSTPWSATSIAASQPPASPNPNLMCASIAASTQSIFERFCTALALQPLLADPRFADNPSRVENWRAIDDIVREAIAQLTLEELGARLLAHQVGFSPIYDAADIFADPHFIAREAIVTVADEELGNVRMQCVVPRFSETPVSVRRAGPSLGQHNDEIYGGLGLSPPEIARLRAAGTI